MLIGRELISLGKEVMFHLFLRSVLPGFKTLKMNLYHWGKNDICNAYCLLVLKWKSNPYLGTRDQFYMIFGGHMPNFTRISHSSFPWDA